MHEIVISRTQAVDADFDALIGPHLDAAYRTALAILGNPDEAHDAVQESAFKAWRKLSQLKKADPHARGSLPSSPTSAAASVAPAGGR